MEFYEKRPVFQAAQFDGTTESVTKLRDVYDFAEYRIDGGSSVITIRFWAGGDSDLLLRRFDWLVKFPDDKLAVMNQSDFRARFEKSVGERAKFDTDFSPPNGSAILANGRRQSNWSPE